MKAKISAPVKETESEEKVRRAVKNLFPETEFQLEDNRVIGETEELGHLTELLEQKKIRNTIQSIAEEKFFNGKTSLKFNKQAAFHEDVNVYEEHPLGPIKLELDCTEEELMKVIWGEDDSGIRSQGEGREEPGEETGRPGSD